MIALELPSISRRSRRSESVDNYLVIVGTTGQTGANLSLLAPPAAIPLQGSFLEKNFWFECSGISAHGINS